MSEINVGGQNITFQYYQEAKSRNFNELLYKVVPKGIVDGGLINIDSTKKVTLNTFSVIIEVATTELPISVKISTSESIDLTSSLTSTNNYIVGEYSWKDYKENYMDIRCVSKSRAKDSAIIFGKVEFVNNEPYSIDYTERTLSKLYFTNQNVYSNFLVTTDDDSKNLIVKPGKAFIAGREYSKDDDTVLNDVFEDGVIHGITIKVYMDKNGEINYVKSEDVANSESTIEIPYNALLLAIVRIPQNATRIFGNYITQVYDFNVNTSLSEESDDQLNPNSENPIKNKTVTEKFNELESYMQDGVSENNKLTTESFVNSSISTNTSNFLGTNSSDTEQLFLNWANGLSNKTNNDYVFWEHKDSNNNTLYTRYKYNAESQIWLKEYDLNNSSFTQSQWGSINSNMTTELTAKLIATPKFWSGTQSQYNAIPIKDNQTVYLILRT